MVKHGVHSYRQRYASSQWSGAHLKMLWTHEAQPSESAINFDHCVWWRVSLSMRVHTTLNHIRFVFYHNIRHNEILISLSWQLKTTTRIWKCTRCIMQMSCLYASEFPLKTLCINTKKQYEKNVWKKSNEAYSLSIRVQTTINHISICFFYHNINVRENVFLQSASWKRYGVTYRREQRGMDFYLPRQISQSDCKISSKCGTEKM